MMAHDEHPVLATATDVAALCRRLATAPYIAVDTEFMRETTFWPKLCLVQIAGPDEAAAIDPLAPGMALEPLLELMAAPRVLKVFHSARQDVEIFVQLGGRVPAPLFDSQVAAMVCGFGDQVSYDTLVARLAHKHIDKSSRFTDWSHRPLSERQVAYALADVTHLRVVYEKLAERIAANGREAWMAEEMAALTDIGAYTMAPDDAWRRLKSRSTNRRFLAVLREVAAYREREAQSRNLPRNRVVRDEALLEIAAHHPTTTAELARTRGLSKGLAEGVIGRGLLGAVGRGLAVPDEQCPEPQPRSTAGNVPGALVDLLKVLLKHQSEEHHVAQRLIASSAELDRLAAEAAPDVPALHGWRREVFGEAALALKDGRLTLGAAGDRIVLL
ncbi:MAG: ribonuclease D, partial [Alphaproteobacteria bacterium]